MSDIVPESIPPSEPFANQFDPYKSLEGLQISRLVELPPQEQELLTYFYDNVIFGDPELRGYAFESYKERCDAFDKLQQNTQNVPTWRRLQEQFIGKLNQNQKEILFARLAKGLQVEVTVQQPLHGLTQRQVHEIYDITDKFGLALQDQEGNRINLARDELEKMREKEFPQNDTNFVYHVDGTVISEFMQGYSMNGIVMEINGKLDSIPIYWVSSFTVKGFNHELAKRRPRELYPDRQLQVWSDTTKQWHTGRMRYLSSPGEIHVDLEKPIQTMNYFSENQQTRSIDVPIGKFAAYPYTKLVIPGDSEFETEGWEFPNIDLEMEEQKKALETSSSIAPGDLFLHPDGRLIAVTSILEDGTGAFVEGNNYNEGHTVTNAQLESYQRLNQDGISPDTLLKFSSVKGKRILIDLKNIFGEKYQGKNGMTGRVDENPYVMLIKDIYVINGIPTVVFEHIPCWLGYKANIPARPLIPLEWTKFEQLNSSQDHKFRVSQQNMDDELKVRFPEEYKLLKENISTKFGHKGLAVCQLFLKNGKQTERQYAFFGSLPFGIFAITDSNEPTLIPLSEIKKIKVG